MSIINIIILVVMPLSVVVSFWVLFKAIFKTKRERIVVVPSYNPSINKLLDEKYQNTGTKLTYGQLLENTDNVLKELGVLPCNLPFDKVLDEKYKNDGYRLTYGQLFKNTDYILNVLNKNEYK